MSTSLMDVLSNGLAAVIILLIIGLSSSKQQQEGYAGATLYLIRVHGSVDVDSVFIHHAKGDTICRLSTERIVEDPILRRRGEFSSPFDSTVHAKLFWPIEYFDMERVDKKSHECHELSVSVSSDASRKVGDFRMEFPLNNLVLGARDTLYYVEFKVINSFSNIPKEYRKIGPFSSRRVLTLIYNSSPTIQ